MTSIPGAGREFVNITIPPRDVEVALAESGTQKVCLVKAMHITAIVFINDAESGLLKDF